MPKTITENNLRSLVDLLAKENARVVGPKKAGSMVLYEPLAQGADLVLDSLPRRSAKEAFFPICETLLTFEKTKDGTRVEDADLSQLPETVLLAARPCDAAAPSILDSVFSWDYDDPFFLERRKKTTIIGLACTKADDACFCTAVGLSPASKDGSDLFLTPVEGGSFLAEAVTEKGEQLLARFPQLFTEAGSVKALPVADPQPEALDLQRIKAWLDGHFEDPLWKQMADICAGCGSCAFLCPACHCFDISDEGTEHKGVRRKSWDACGYGKFTNHASGHNPRDHQPQRYRNRIMHKFKYYDDKFGKRLCTGCGRCIRFCPVGIDIKQVLDEINKG